MYTHKFTWSNDNEHFYVVSGAVETRTFLGIVCNSEFCKIVAEGLIGPDGIIWCKEDKFTQLLSDLNILATCACYNAKNSAEMQLALKQLAWEFAEKCLKPGITKYITDDEVNIIAETVSQVNDKLLMLKMLLEVL